MLNQELLVLVTGAGGVLGTALIARLREIGVKNILCPTRKVLDLEICDNVEAYFRELKPEFVFHLAAMVFGLAGNMSNQYSALTVNTRINDHVMSAAKKYPPRKIFFAGTVASYPFPYRTLPLREDEFHNGLPHYGEYGYSSAKRHALSYLTVLAKDHGIPFTYGILTNLYGPNDRFDPTNGHVIPSLVRKLHESKATGQPLEIWGDGSATRDFMFAADAAEAIVLALEKAEGLINIASGELNSIRQVVDALVQSSGFAGEILWRSDKPTGIPERSVNAERLSRLEFKPRHSLASGLCVTYEWFDQNRAMLRT